MSNCKLCNRLVGSVSVALTGTNLVINIPDGSYNNCSKLCLAILQPVPTTVTRGTPVVITIGDDATTYQVVKCDGTPLTQEYIGQGNVYKLQVHTTTTSAIFKAVNSLCMVSTDLRSIPV